MKIEESLGKLCSDLALDESIRQSYRERIKLQNNNQESSMILNYDSPTGIKHETSPEQHLRRVPILGNNESPLLSSPDMANEEMSAQ